MAVKTSPVTRSIPLKLTAPAGPSTFSASGAIESAKRPIVFSVQPENDAATSVNEDRPGAELLDDDGIDIRSLLGKGRTQIGR